MTQEDLFNTLEDLGDEEFKTFKWYLQQPDILVGYQTIKKSELENAERRDTVDLMVNTFKLHGALMVTKDVLNKMNRNDLLECPSDSGSESEEVQTDGVTISSSNNTNVTIQNIYPRRVIRSRRRRLYLYYIN